MRHRSGHLLGRRGALTALFGIAFLAAPHPARPFAGEDFLEGNPWHHEAISEDALHAKNFGEPAVQEIAWNADYVDSYLYNPLWWIPGGLSRFKASMATFGELEKVHFDDNFSGDHIRRTWRRYLTGCMAGLVWAAERNDIGAGRNIVGVSLHAIQDFYSHSNWIDDPDRRTKTWFEYEKAQRDRLAIYAGAYEHAEQTGVKPHGKIAPGCSVLSRPLLKPFFEPGCSAFSPLHNSQVCDYYEECKTAKPIQPNLYGLKVPENVLYASPPGMNLDARWSAGIGVRVRGLSDLNGDQAFDLARGLAKRNSEQWLERVREKLEAMGFGAYWRQVMVAPDTSMKEKQYENFSRFPYHFISAGPYPPDLRTPEEEWYLRLQIRTGSERGAGTDADIYAEADGKRFLLDYTPRANPILNHNDFESGDDEVYTVGPFAKLPAKVTIFNDSAGGPEIARALAQSAADSVRGLADTVGDTLLSLVAGHADKVGTNRILWTPDQLASIPPAGRAFTVQVNGGDEGNYRIDGKITKTGQAPAGTAEPWHEFRVQITSLYCFRESSVDRLSPSEEPYVMALLVPFPGSILKYRTDPIRDTDAGETKPIRYTFPTVRLPKAHGMLSLPVSIWESDSESDQTRRNQLLKFADEAERQTGPARQAVRDALGASVGADWQVASLTVYAFNRGGEVLKTGKVYDRSVNEWIKGKERKSYNLAPASLKSYAAVDARTIDVLSSESPTPVGPQPPVTPNPPSNWGVGKPLDRNHPNVAKPVRTLTSEWLDYVEREIRSVVARAKKEMSGKRKRASGRQDSDFAIMDDAFIESEFDYNLNQVKNAKAEWARQSTERPPLERQWQSLGLISTGIYALYAAQNTYAGLHFKAIGSEWYTDTYRKPSERLREIRSQPESSSRTAQEESFKAERAKAEDAQFERAAEEIRSMSVYLMDARLRALRNYAYFREIASLQSLPPLSYMSPKERLIEDYDKRMADIAKSALSLSGFSGDIHLYATFSSVKTVRYPDLEVRTPRHLSLVPILGKSLDSAPAEAIELVRTGKFSAFGDAGQDVGVAATSAFFTRS